MPLFESLIIFIINMFEVTYQQTFNLENKPTDFGTTMPVLHGLLYSFKTTLHSQAQSGFELDGATLSALNLVALPLSAWIEQYFLNKLITKSTITAMSVIMMGVVFIAVFKFKDKGKSSSNTVTNSLNFSGIYGGEGGKKDANVVEGNQGIGGEGRFDKMNGLGGVKVRNKGFVDQGEEGEVNRNDTVNMVKYSENESGSKLNSNKNESGSKLNSNKNESGSKLNGNKIVESKENNSKLNDQNMRNDLKESNSKLNNSIESHSIFNYLKESNSKLNDSKLNNSIENNSQLDKNLSHNNSEINSQNDLIENIFKSSTNSIKLNNNDLFEGNLKDEEDSIDSETPNTDNLQRQQDVEPELDQQANLIIKFQKMVAHITGTMLECFMFLIVHKTFEQTNYSTTYQFVVVNLYKLIFISLQGFFFTYQLQAYNPNMLSAIQTRYEQQTQAFFASDDFNLSQMSKQAYIQAISARFSNYYYMKKAQVSVLGVKINCWGQVISPFVFATETIMQEQKQDLNIITIIGMIQISLGIKMHAITQMRQAKQVRDQGQLSKKRSNGDQLDFS